MINEARATVSLDDVYIPSIRSLPASTVPVRRELSLPDSGWKDLPGKIPTVNLNDSFYDFPAVLTRPIPPGRSIRSPTALTKVWGNHTFKFGFSYEYSGENDEDQINVTRFPAEPATRTALSISLTAATNLAPPRESGVANLAWGLPTAIRRSARARTRSGAARCIEAFAQDSWKVTPNSISITASVKPLSPGIHALWGNSNYFILLSTIAAQAVALTLKPVTSFLVRAINTTAL